MSSIRSVLALCLAVAGGFAYGSFELVMVADNGTGTFASRKIHRFDGDNGLYMGSFGGFGGDIIGTHLNQTTNSLFVYSNDFRLAEYDYNTGALKRSYNTNIGLPGQVTMVVVRPNETSAVWLNGGNAPLAYSFPNTGGSGSFTGLNFGTGMYGGVWLDNDRFLAYHSGFMEQAILYSVAPNGLSGTMTGYFNADINGFSQMTYLSAIDTVVHPAFDRLLTYFPSQSAWGFVPTPGVENRHSSRAHDGFFTMGRRSGTWTLDKYDSTFGQRGQFAASMVINPASMQTVVAPEPGSAVVLGLGLVALLRRRRTSNGASG